MITIDQQDHIRAHAYVPEHVLSYVNAISQAEPFLFGEFIVYVKKNHLIFVGYPLDEDFDERRMVRTLEDAMKRFKPEDVALIAPAIPPSLNIVGDTSSDHYYRLDLSTLTISQKLRNMLNRASRELVVERNQTIDEEHRKMVDDFIHTHPIDEKTQVIFQRVRDYVSSSTHAWVFNARNKKEELVAFDVAEFGPQDYALYMFNFSSNAFQVPGASDLLLSEVVQQAKAEGKRYINLGLGINPGVTFFKKKWGGIVFLPYAFCMYTPSSRNVMETLIQKL